LSFVAADAYDRYMGRYSAPLAPGLADYAGVSSGQRVLDVGCGTGALVAELAARLGPAAVTAVDPSEPFVAAVGERFPEVEAHRAPAEELPFQDATFDAALAQLVVHFMADPVVGIREMGRVTRPGGVVAACVWDFGGDADPLSLFWAAARALDTQVEGEAHLAGAREGHLAELFEEAGLREVEDTVLSITVEHPTFEDWWEPFTLGVGPGGSYVAGLAPDEVERLREEARKRLPDPPFALTGQAWAVRGRAAA
jgi:ubiquinone/menaquinone biosynthesis C-methylase UbiE